jgi:hypothetical protein
VFAVLLAAALVAQAPAQPRIAGPRWTVTVTPAKTTLTVEVDGPEIATVMLVPKDGDDPPIAPTKTTREDGKTLATFPTPRGDFLISFTTAAVGDQPGRSFHTNRKGSPVYVVAPFPRRK